MPKGQLREVIVGSCAAILLAIVLVVVAIGGSESDSAGRSGTITISADFDRVDGLSVDSPVRLAGVPIGRVARVELNANHRAAAFLEVREGLNIPEDTAAVIETDGVFGEKYVELHPGGAEEAVSDGDRLAYTQDSVVLESLLNQIVARAKSRQSSSAETGDID